jgi:hypothetical protein
MACTPCSGFLFHTHTHAYAHWHTHAQGELDQWIEAKEEADEEDAQENDVFDV